MSDKMRAEFEARFPVYRIYIHFDDKKNRYCANEPYVFGSDRHAAEQNLRWESWQAAHADAIADTCEHESEMSYVVPLPDGEATTIMLYGSTRDLQRLESVLQWFHSREAEIRAAALPPGFVAVPVEPTPRMQAEAWDGIEKASWFGMNYNEAARKVWADMLAARPDPQP
jgi:hypothetical protein